MDRAGTRLGVAGKLIQAQDLICCLDSGADYVSLGKVAILNRDYPLKLAADQRFVASWLPVTTDYLRGQYIGEAFISSLGRYNNFLSDYEGPPDASKFDILGCPAELAPAARPMNGEMAAMTPSNQTNEPPRGQLGSAAPISSTG